MHNNSEIPILLQIVKGNPDMPPEFSSSDTTRLIQLAERHRVVYHVLLFAQQHPGLFAAEQKAALENRCRQGALRSLTQLHELKVIAGALHDRGIEYACIKGPQLSRMIYGREALKESVDLDIMLVHAEDLFTVHDILGGLGYTRSNLNQYKGRFARKVFLIAKREVHYYNQESHCAIDLHIRPGANTYLTAKYFSGFLSTLASYDLEGTTVPVLSNEAYFVYLCYHGSLHQFSRLAWLMDIRALYYLKNSEFDYAKIWTIALSLRATRNVSLVMLLLQDYFGDDIPPQLQQQLIRSKRMDFLVSGCRKMINRDAAYGLSLRGRADRFIYLLVLIHGFSGKLDLLYGIFIRQAIKWLAG